MALAQIIFGFPQLNVPQVLALVAVLHMVESVLIFFSGHLGAVPAFFRDRSGRIVGGFTLQKFWPIPITALAIMVIADMPPGSVDMPEWWPLIRSGVANPENTMYMLIPVMAALGYGDMAIARNPRQKSWISAGYLALYSVILLGLAVLSDRSLPLAVLAALFAPLGHELVIYIGRNLEMRDPPVYVTSRDGLAVLDVIPDSLAWRAGIRSGDLVMAINGMPVHKRVDLESVNQGDNQSLAVDFLSRRKDQYRSEVLSYSKQGSPLGILPVPEGNEEEGVMEISTTGSLGRWFSSFLRRFQ